MFLIRLLEKGWAVESAKRGARFLLSLYKNRDCFLFISSFLAGKEAKEAGGTYDGSPSTPFQRPTGAPPLSVDPAQEEGVDVSHQAVVRTAPRGRRATAALPKMSVGGVFVSCPILVWDRLNKVLGNN